MYKVGGAQIIKIVYEVVWVGETLATGNGGREIDLFLMYLYPLKKKVLHGQFQLFLSFKILFLVYF